LNVYYSSLITIGQAKIYVDWLISTNQSKLQKIKMKTLLNIQVVENRNLVLLRTFNHETNSTGTLIVPDYDYVFYIKNNNNIKEIDKIKDLIVIERVTAKCFSTYYQEDSDGELFFKITILKYLNVEHVMSKLRWCGFEVYEADVDIKNKFLLSTELKINSSFTSNESYKDIELVETQRIDYKVFYFSVFIQKEKNKTPIPRWTKTLADHYDYDIAEVLYNPVTNPITIITSLTVENEKITLTIYKIGKEEIDIYGNITNFTSLFTNKEIETMRTFSFKDELSMLQSFVQNVHKYDAHYMVGWGIHYDISYIRERIVFLTQKINDDVFKSEIYLFYEAFTGFDVDIINKDETFQTNLKKKFSSMYDHMYDSENWIINNMKLLVNIVDLETAWYSKLNNNKEHKHGCSLESVFKTVFGQDIIVPEMEIANKHVYIYQTKRVVELFVINEKKDFLSNIVEVCKNIPITVDQVLSRGQSCRVKHKLLEYIHKENMVLKTTMKNKAKDKFEGGYMLKPDVEGFESDKIAEFDFVSYYPSIIIDFNICFTTLAWTGEDIPKEIKENEKDYTFVQIDETWHAFCKVQKEGIFPKMCKEFLTKRYEVKRKKNLLEDKFGDDFKRLEIEEKMLKDFINSIYGVSSSYLFENVRIGAVITFIGRFLNIHISEIIRDTSIKEGMIHLPPTEDLKVFRNYWDDTAYLKKRSCKKSMSITYANTDSIFVKYLFKTENDIYNKQQLSIELCSRLNDLFKSMFGSDCYLKLEYKSLLLSSFWLHISHYYYVPLNRIITVEEEDFEVYKEHSGKFESKGSVLVESDTFLFVKNMVYSLMTRVFSFSNMLIKGEIKHAIDDIFDALVKETTSLLEDSEIKLSEWTLTNKIKREENEYKGNNIPPHMKMIQYLSFVDKETFSKPVIGQNIQTVYYNGNVGETKNMEELKRMYKRNITMPSLLLKKKQKINMECNILEFKTSLVLIVRNLLKEKYNTSEIEDKINEFFVSISPNKKRSCGSLFDLERFNKDYVEVCKNCIESNQLEIEDIGQCGNYECRVKQDHDYRVYNFNI
jgi:DNA polymerase elongation subunit (family B)